MQRVESRPAPPSQGLQGCGSEASEAHEGEAPEMQSQGSHRSLYDRAFGGGFGDMHHAHMPSPWQQHSDLIGDRECEEMLYRRQMAMAAQDRARSVSLHLPRTMCQCLVLFGLCSVAFLFCGKLEHSHSKPSK